MSQHKSQGHVFMAQSSAGNSALQYLEINKQPTPKESREKSTIISVITATNTKQSKAGNRELGNIRLWLTALRLIASIATIFVLIAHPGQGNALALARLAGKLFGRTRVAS